MAGPNETTVDQATTSQSRTQAASVESGGQRVQANSAGVVDPRISGALDDRAATSRTTAQKTADSVRKGADGHDKISDKAEEGARKIRDGKDKDKGKDKDGKPKKGISQAELLKALDSSNGKGGDGQQGGAGGQQQQPNSGQYQSAMPQQQSAPQQSAPASMPTAGQSPTQSMIGAGTPAAESLANAITGKNAEDAKTGGDNTYRDPKTGVEVPGSGKSSVTGTGKVKDLQELANRLVEEHHPYAWGGGGPNGPSKGISDGGGPADQAGDYNKVGFDCSGLAQYVGKQIYGVDLPRVSQDQINAGESVSTPQPGDLVFPSSAGSPPTHVQIYIGDGQVLEAPSSGQYVKISNDQPGSRYVRIGNNEDAATLA